MATIEELLGASPEDIAKMTDAELEVYLADITNLEPKIINKEIVGEKETEEPEEKDDNPIKIKKKKNKSKSLQVRELQDEMSKLERELGL